MASFDNITHEFLLQAIGEFPAKELIRQWLKAGYLEDGVRHDTPAGTPQGGVISPLLLNVALHGMEDALGVRFNTQGRTVGTRAVVRYADDFVVFCESQEDAILVMEKILPDWLKARGLSLSPEKTRVIHLTEGFDFLGFTIKRYEMPRTTKTGYKLLITPSKKSVASKRKELRDLWRSLRGHGIKEVLTRLNPVIRGWANYFRTAVASATFRKMDTWMFHREIRFAKRAHPQKSHAWRREKYWGKLNKDRDDHWVFGDKRTGRYLLKFSWFSIVRHPLVRGLASPDDASLKEYWWARQKVHANRLTPGDRKLGLAQEWVCPYCRMPLMNGEDLHRHHRIPKGEGGSDAFSNRELVHLFCHQQRHRTRRNDADAVSD
jgi:RNA-directed DNA polymerase